MGVSRQLFGTMPDGTEIFCWTILNEKGFAAKIIDYGATVQSIVVPDKNGTPIDVVLGYDTLEEYILGDCYIGATVGRFANRIKEGRFELDGKKYELCINNGPNHLHGGKKGFDKHIWVAKQFDDKIVFSRTSPDGEEDYPGKLDISVTFSWEGDSFKIEYEAETDRDTILNLTNHSYFNLNGAGNGNVDNHFLKIEADHYTVCDENCTPTGELAPVEGTAMDFRIGKNIGKDAYNDEPCVKPFGGYDANFVINGHPFAVATGDKTGITLAADTDQPGVQLYTANALTEQKGKGNADYGFRSAFCLETQHFPDCANHPEWPSPILRKGEKFHSVTTYTFL